MNRDALETGTVALGGVVALAFGAATLTETGGARGDGGGLPFLEGGGALVPPKPPETAPASGATPVIPEELLLALAVLATVVAVGYVVVNWRKVPTILALVFAFVLVVLALIQVLSAWFGGAGGALGLGGGSGGLSFPFSFSLWPWGKGSGGADRAVEYSPGSLLWVALVGVAVVGVAVALWRRDDAEADLPAEVAGSASDDDADVAAVGRVAGLAADRIEGAADVDNEVYRAWREMTALLDPARPETMAPGEFAEAAVAAGMADDDVSELTALFEVVRYGGRTPSPADEERAVAVFRRIESSDTGESA